MPFSVIIIVLFSALMHAAWNLLARKRGRAVAFFGRTLLVVLLVGFVPCVASEWYARSIPLLSWLCMACSAICLSLYMYCLGRAYNSSDFTVVYPLVRGLPVLFTGLFDASRARFPTAAGWIGMFMVMAGCVMSPQHSFRDMRLRNYLDRAIFWVLIAAFATVGYNVFDKIAQEHVTAGYASAARYAYFLYALWCGFYWVLIRLFKVPESEEDQTGQLGWKWPALAAVCTFLSYSLVLFAYQIVDKAGYVVAFRQVSILFGVFVAVFAFKEQGVAIRLTGTLFMAAGLVLIAVMG